MAIMQIRRISAMTASSRMTNEHWFVQVAQDFKAVGNAIQSGDLDRAKEALSLFQKDLQQTPATASLGKLFQGNGLLGSNFHSVRLAVQSNNRAQSQSALNALAEAMERLIALKDN